MSRFGAIAPLRASRSAASSCAFHPAGVAQFGLREGKRQRVGGQRLAIASNIRQTSGVGLAGLASGGSPS